MIVAHTCLREALWDGHGFSCQILTCFVCFCFCWTLRGDTTLKPGPEGYV